ncbi:WD40/YVTN/BNR-like repeat-containing protein [Sediminibacterium sp.]|uniref:WD40/YVTN/BNR-like repeat-containing protein n=1 Tax=Sediminibacterium sp. TaxID=1917865 RepID=UPI003F695FDA
MTSYLKIFLLAIMVHSFTGMDAQTNPSIEVLTQGTKTSMRGLSVVSEKIFWVSGSNGMVGKSIDGGKNIQWIQVPGFEKRDFRDIEAYSDQVAIIMAIADPAIILKTKDGGNSWYTVFADSTKGMFLDAMHANGKSIQVIGDPINGKAFFAISNNQGESWESQVKDAIPLQEGEAFFASSGSNLQMAPSGNQFKAGTWMVTGGKASRIINARDQRDVYALPLIQGKESTGANSIDISPSGKFAFIVGGDFARDTLREGNAVKVVFGKSISFTQPTIPPHGYRSSVVYINENILISCGTSGVDISRDGGMHWSNISRLSFHVVQKAKTGNAVFLAGGGGRIAKLLLE